jgi:hypothetical protein
MRKRRNIYGQALSKKTTSALLSFVVSTDGLLGKETIILLKKLSAA